MPPARQELDDIEITSDGVMYAEGVPPGGLEALLSSKAIVSEVVIAEHGGETKTVKFRELSNDQKQAIMTFAIQYMEDRRREQEEDGKGEWRDAESDRDVLVGEEMELRMLQAAMLDPTTNGPACSLTWLRRRMGTQLQTKLGQRYAAFELLIDPEKVDEDIIKAVLDSVKKNIPIESLCMECDSVLLARCLQYSVALLSNLATVKSSGGSTRATKRTRKPKKRASKSAPKKR